MRLRILSLITVVFMLPTNLSGGGREHNFYVHYSTFDGLPDSYIVCCNQDKFNRMWVGTRDGVYYYAGSSFVPFENPDYLASCSRMTTAIGVDMYDNIWLGSSDGVGFYDIRNDLFTPIPELADESVDDIDFDATGKAWLTTGNGIWCYDRRNSVLEKKVSSDVFSPSCTCFTDKGELVFTARNDNIYVYDVETSSLRIVKTGTDGANSSFRYVAYAGGRYVIVSANPKKVVRLNIDTGEETALVGPDLIENMAEVQCLIVRGNHYWIGTSYGLIIYDSLTGSIERQFPDKVETNALGGESVRYLYEDNEGNIWAGTFNGGLRCWMAYQETFSRYIANGNKGSIVGETVRSITPDRYGYIWVGTEEGHLNRFSPLTKTFENYTSHSDIPYGTSIVDMENIGTNIWIATYGSGLIVFDPKAGRTVRHYDLPSEYCMVIYKTSSGVIYIGTANGLYKYDERADSFQFIDVVGNKFIHCLHEDLNGKLWVGTYGSGLGLLDLNTGFFRMEAVKDEIGLESNFIISMFDDNEGSLWITTDGAGIGKVAYSPENGNFSVKHFTKEDGLPSNTAVSISDAGKGHLWVATTNGLVYFDLRMEKIIKTYMQEDRVIGNHFTNRANYIDSDKRVYLGTSEGLLVFDPIFLVEKFRDTPLYITNIISGTGKEKKVVSQKDHSVITSEEIVLTESEAAYLNISFSSMKYSSPNAMSYDCTLTKFGFHSELTTAESRMAYTGLGPGRYDFTVNYHDSEDISTQGKISFIIKAPWYKSFWGYMTYLLILILAVVSVLYVRKERTKTDMKRKMEIKEIERQNAIAHEKIDFLANIAHEIRTPVTLIALLFDKMSENGDIPEHIRKDISDSQMSLDRLKSLCSDVLDLRKMEHLQKNIVITEEDITRITRSAIKAFRSIADSRNIRITTDIPDEAVMVFCSVDAVDSILSNLLSNAVKYSGSCFEVSVVEGKGEQ